ncbi:MAG: alanine--tRNA ligase [Bacilli bacterium]
MNIKDLYIDFFISKGHKKLNSAPIIPENDPTCLFNSAGMQPLVPYLVGAKHPLGKRLTNCQKCFRLTDLDAIGDKTHHTFFEMLGNWSLGDYFKEEAIKWSFEFLTKHLDIPLEKLAVTVFQGNDFVEKDITSMNIWLKLGISEKRIAFLGEADNWWSGGDTGPCGPDTEIFYFTGDHAPLEFDPTDNRWVEIWNNVFMQYNHLIDGSYVPLNNKNVDTGMGVERVTAVLEGVDDNYKTSIWCDIILKIEQITNLSYDDYYYEMRIIADHIRSIVIISGDDAKITPSNTDQGYILRRLIRRMLRYAKKLNIDINSDFDVVLADIIIDKYKKSYPELAKNASQIKNILVSEKKKFAKTLEKGLHEFDKNILKLSNDCIDASLAFKLYDTYGFPIELTLELAKEHKLNVDVEGFKLKFKEHQNKSRRGSSDKFKGGLSSDSIMDVKYHTATHLLNAALKIVLGNHVHQMGSNITPERLRFDFSHNGKMTEEEKKETEVLVNSWINQELPVTKQEMVKEEALKIGAEAMFIDKYGDMVTIYKIGDISLEICGGPHVNNTRELGNFKIKKEEASAAGIRRIKAILTERKFDDKL